MATYISARPLVINESAGFVDVVVTLSGVSAQTVSLNYSYNTSSASFNDFTFSPGSLSFAPGETSKTVRVPLTNDTASEPNESFYVTFNTPVNGVLVQSQVVITIAANDASPGTPNASIRDVVVDEKAGVAQIVVMLDKPALDTVQLNFATADDTANAGVDYVLSSGTLFFTPGQTTQTITVPITDDITAEGDEMFGINLSAPLGLVLLNSHASVRIVASDAANAAQPLVWVEDSYVDESAGYVDVVFRLSAPSAQQVSVTYNSATATASSTDFNQNIDGILVFAPGETTRVLRIDITDDTAADPVESFSVGLSLPINAVIGKTYGIVTIGSNDTSPGVPSASVDDVMVDERAGAVQFVIRLDKPSTDPVTLAFATGAGSATAGADYISQSGSIGFAPGETLRTVTVQINDDVTAEGFERFFLTLSNPVGATIAQATASADIAPSDNTPVSTPVINVDSVVVDEASGVANVVFRLSAPSAQQVSVNYADSYNNTSFNDYAYYLTGTVAFAPGETLKTVRYLIVNDSGSEGTESFRVTLSAPVNAVIGNSLINMFIGANDGSPGVPVASVSDVTVDERGGMAQVVLTLDKPSTDVVSVSYASSAGTATAGSDFTAVSGAVSFQPGETVRTIFVPILDEAVAEGDEFFTIGLSAPVGLSLGQATGTVWIGANDATPVSNPVIRILPAVVNEQAGYADVIVALSAPSAQTVSVNYVDVYSGNSANYTDYTYSSSGTLIFAPGETVKTLRYGLVVDNAAERAESFYVGLNTPVNAVVGNSFTTVTLASNDGAAGIPTASVREAVVDEKGGAAAFVVVLDRPSTELVTLSYRTVAGTATADVDYSSRSGTLAFAPGETSRVVFIPIIDDALAEKDEVFTLEISSPVNASIAQGLASGRIVANDAANVANPVIIAEPLLADEARGYADVLVRLSAPSAQTVSVTYGDNYLNNAYTDYGYSQDGVLNFAPGETAKLVRYWIADDTAAESAQAFFLRLSAPLNAVIGNTRTLVTIVPNDASPGVPHISISPVTVDEKAGVAVFSVLLDKPSTDLVTLDFATADGTALADDINPQDYTAQVGTLAFQPGEMLRTVVVPIRDDANAEGDEFFRLNLSNAVGATLAQTGTTARIVANDAANVATPLIFIDSMVVNEGDGFADVIFRLSAPTAQQVTVVYSDEYTGTIYTDYSYSSTGTMIFAPGETVKTMRYALTGDVAAEPAESFVVQISSPVNGAIGTPYATVTIASQITHSGVSWVRVDNATVDESSSAAFVVTLSEPALDNVQVHYATANGTAIAGLDYVATSGTVGFAPGQTTQTVWVPIINDALAEGDELFSLVLSAPVGAGIAQTTAVARIGASDATPVGTPVITVESVVANESTGYVDVVFKLSAPSLQQISVNYADEADGTSNTDYLSGNSGVLIFAPGETIKTVRYGISDDAASEPEESFTIRLSTPINVAIGNTYATVTIAANDGTGAQLPSASVGSITVDEKSGMARFVVSLDIPSTDVLRFNWSTADGTALAGSDYAAQSGTVSFLPGETTQTVLVPIIDDALNEPDEIFSVVLSAPVGAGIAQGTATARIAANDAANVATPQISAASIEVNESDGYADVVFRLSAPSGNQVGFSISDSYTGTIYLDYNYSNSGIVTFAPGETVKTIRYGIVDDNISEPAESFLVKLATPVNATLGNTQASVTIIDRDGGPVATFSDNIPGTAIGPITYTLTFTQPVTGLTTDDFTLVYGSIASLSGVGDIYTIVVTPAPNTEDVSFITLRIDAVLNASLIGNMPASSAQVIDTLVPVITSFNPLDEATLILRETNIVMGLSQRVQFGVGSILLKRGDGTLAQSFDVTAPAGPLVLSADGRTLTLDPTNKLLFNTGYSVEFSTGVLGDASGNSVAALSTYNFTTLPNTPPVSTNGAGNMLEDNAISAALPAFFDPDLHVVQYLKVSDPAHGTASITSNGLYTYTPAPNYNGSDSFTFKVIDEEGASNTYTMTMSITPVNDLPTASNTTLLLDEDSSVSSNLPAASDVDGDVITYARTGNASKGIVLVNANGSYSYTPNPNANGADSFGYSVSDGNGGVSNYTVAITITPVNDPPVGANGAASTQEDIVLVATLPVASDVDGDTLTYALGGVAPTHGNVVVQPGGGYTYTPEANYSGSDGFSYFVNDGHGGASSWNIGLTITSVVDTFNGTSGADNMPGYPGADVYNGLDGNDTITPGTGNDTVNGGNGIDRVSYAERSAAVQVNLASNLATLGVELDALNSIEGAIGGSGNDSLTGDINYNIFFGGPGNDTLNGAAGNDVADYRGGAAINVNLQTGVATQGADTDTLIGIEAIFGGTGNDVIRGFDGIEAKYGDTIRGGPGNDSIDGGTGNDTAEFVNARAAYTISRPNPATLNIAVTHNLGGIDGTDTLNNVERLIFADQLLGFGQRAEEVARVAFVLWSPVIAHIPAFQTLFARGLSFYDVGYDFNYLCQTALLFWPQQGAEFANILVTNAPGTSKSVNDVLAIMSGAGGGEAGRTAAVSAMALDAATTNQIELSGIRTNGVVADLFVQDFGQLFSLLPG